MFLKTTCRHVPSIFPVGMSDTVQKRTRYVERLKEIQYEIYINFTYTVLIDKYLCVLIKITLIMTYEKLVTKFNPF